MKCPKCGAELPDGSGFCGFCGTDLTQLSQTVQQPQQPQFNQPQQPQFNQPQQPQFNQPQQPQFGQQPMGQPQQPQFNQPQQPQFGQPMQPQYGQPMGQPSGAMPQPGYRPAPNFANGLKFDFSGFGRIISSNKLSICTLAGAALLFIFLFIPGWMKIKASWGGIDLSSYMGSAAKYTIFNGIGLVWGFLMLVGALALIAVRFDVISGGIVDKIKSMNYSEFYLAGGLFVLWILCLIHSFAYKASGGYGVTAGTKPGIMMWLALLAIAATLVEPVLSKVQGTQYFE